ncbi:MAG: MFS transporter [Coriobacteriia bacterium]|nr:MFS transporter [Coriobacteriia bacterium]
MEKDPEVKTSVADVIKKNYGFGVQAAALAVITFQYAKGFSTPALGAITKAFPNVPVETVKQIESLPSLMAIFGAIAVGVLERFMKKRTILWIAMLCTLLGGIAPAFLNDINSILIARIVLGFGRGMIFPMSSSFIADLFSGDVRDRLMGYKTAVGALSGSAFQLIGGALAVMSWRYTFIAYLFIVPIILLVAIKLPEPDVKPIPVGSGRAQMSMWVWVIIIWAGVYNFFQFSMFTNMAITVAKTKLGTAALSGTLLTTVTLSSAVGATLYGYIRKYTKGFELPASVVLVATGFLILVTKVSIPNYYFGAIVWGLGFGIFNPALIMATVRALPRESATMGLSILAGVQNGGQYLSSFVLVFLGGLAGVSGTLAGWQISWVGCYVMAALALVGILYINGKTKNNPELVA